MVMVVDDQTDIYNWDEVYHAFCTRCHPANGIHIYRNSPGTPLYPFATPHERKHSIGSKVVFDCLWPTDWDKINDVPTLVSFKHVYPQDIQDRVLANWTAYGYPPVK
jgi:4-hydroxy-3-polyprenylbenzoate decarboxylase